MVRSLLLCVVFASFALACQGCMYDDGGYGYGYRRGVCYEQPCVVRAYPNGYCENNYYGGQCYGGQPGGLYQPGFIDQGPYAGLRQSNGGFFGGGGNGGQPGGLYQPGFTDQGPNAGLRGVGNGGTPGQTYQPGNNLGSPGSGSAGRLGPARTSGHARR